MRPLVDTLNKTFSNVPKLDRLTVDEQMRTSKIGSYIKQYLPNKPKNRGLSCTYYAIPRFMRIILNYILEHLKSLIMESQTLNSLQI